jgi:hypothetical protein
MGLVEKKLSEEFKEPVKFNGFVEIDEKVQYKFKFTNPDTQLLPFNATWEDLHELVK